MNSKTRSITWIVIVIFVLIAFIIWIVSLPKIPEEEIISRNGIHYHSTLSLKIKGEDVSIPANIGISSVHNPIHTHDPDGVIHMEFNGLVRKNDLKLSEFFRAWGEDFSHDSIMGNKTGTGGTVKMMVNATENVEFENYIMRDGDKIEIIYE